MATTTKPRRPGLLVLNFGGPQGPEELQPFLANLFEDVLPLPPWLGRWVAPLVASRRARLVQPSYEAINWSPLVPQTAEQLEALRTALGQEAPPMAMGMLFTAPFVDEAIASLREQGADALVALALFPQFSLSTTSAAYTRVHAALAARGEPELPVHYVPAFYDHPRYIEAVAATVRRAAEALPGEGPVHLLFSPHGLPLSYIRRGDPYPEQVRETARRVVAELAWQEPWHLAWQSRVGPVRWLTPSTEDEVARLALAGARRLVVVPISFVGEHIETLHELDIELVEHAHAAGIPHVARAPALGTEPGFIEALADTARHGLRRFQSYRCVRCLVPKPHAHRQRASCPNCQFKTPDWLRAVGSHAPE